MLDGVTPGRDQGRKPGQLPVVLCAPARFCQFTLYSRDEARDSTGVRVGRDGKHVENDQRARPSHRVWIWPVIWGWKRARNNRVKTGHQHPVSNWHRHPGKIPQAVYVGGVLSVGGKDTRFTPDPVPTTTGIDGFRCCRRATDCRDLNTSDVGSHSHTAPLLTGPASRYT
jgi:hypothetical protein